MANKETRIYKTDTLEKLRQKSNEISLHLGDNEQLNALMADKTYVYSASAGQTLFAGPDTSSPAKTSRFETSPAHTIDNTAGYIILESVSSLDASYVQDAVIYQGTSGTPSWQGYIVSATTDKILVRDSSGTFSTTADLKVGASSPDTVAAAKIIRIVIESYPVAIARVYNGGTELTQGMGPNGFHSVNIKATITQTGSPTLTNYTEGVTIYQGDTQATQALVESNSTWYGTLHSVSDGVIRVKTYNGTFSASTLIRALGSNDTITGTNHGPLVVVDNTYGTYIQLTTPASSAEQIKVFSLDLVAAINELQDDIGTVESLTTAANDLVLAINEHDAELGTITSIAMGTTASTVETAIREHEDQIGNVDITGIDAVNDTITGALDQLHDEVGDVTAINLGTSASNLTAAVREHEDQIGNENITSIDSGSDTITGALNQLHTEVGDLDLHTTSTDLTEAINELEEDLFNGEGGTKRTRASLLTTDKSSIVDSINELHKELFVNGTGVSFTGLSADFFKEAIEELRTELGNHTVLDTNVTTDAVSAINELENVLRDDTTQRTGYVMGTNANNVVAAINEIETFLRGENSDYELTTGAQNVRDSLREHETQIGNMLFGTGGPVDAADSTNLSAAVRVLDAEIGDTPYTGIDLTTAIRNTQDDILTAGSLTTLTTTNKFIQGAINEIEADLFNAGNAGTGGDRREMSDLKTADKTSIVDSINEIYDDIHTAGSVTLNTNANFLVGAINEIEGVFDASQYEISAGANAFNVTSGAFTIDAGGDIVLDAAGDDIILKEAGDEFGRFTSTALHQLVLKSGANQTFLTASNTNATFNNNLTVENDLVVNVNTAIGGTLGVSDHTSLSTLGTSGGVGIGASLSVTGTTELDSTLGVDGDFRVGSEGTSKFDVVAASGNTQIDGTLEVDGATGVDGNFRVGSTGTSKFDVVAASGNTQIDGNLEVDGTGGFDNNFRVGGGDFATGKVTITATSGNTEIAGTLGGNGDFRIGSAGADKFNVTASNGNTQIDGTLDVDGNFEVGATKFNVTATSGDFVAKGTGRVDGHTDLNSSVTIDGITSITNTTQSSVSSATDGALIVAGGASIGKNLYVGGNLQVEGTQTVLNTETLTVEDTLVLAGNNLEAEPATGGFGLEVGPLTSPTGLADGVTGAHSIVYNYGHDNGDGTYGQWEADGSLILSTATLATPQIEGVDFGPNDNLTFSAGSGLSESSVKTGATIVTNYINTDKGSAQNIFKTVAPSSGTSATADTNSDTLNLTQGTGITTVGSGDNIITITNSDRGSVAASALRMFKTFTIDATPTNDVVADSNADTLNLRGLDSITLTSTPGTDTINIDHDNHGTAGTYGITGTQDGQYIKSIITNAQGHVTGVTSADFDTRYQATNPSFEIKVNDVKVDDVFPGDAIDLIEGSGIDISGSLVGTESGITISHQDTSSVGNLSQDNSGNTFIQDLAFTFDTFGHVTGATASTGTVSIGNGATTVTAGSGISLGGDTNWSANQSAASTFSVSHADTSSAASVNNSGRTYIQDITLDTFGHITAISSATESYVYTPPTYPGDDINIDTGLLTGATVISDLDFNITTNTLGHVTDANATIATRNLTLANLGWDGWDLYTEGTKRADINVNGIVNFADDGFLTTTYSSTNNTVSYGHPATALNGTYGGDDNGIVIESVTVDTRGHLTAVGTRDLDGRFDNYGSWNIGDGSTTSAVTSGNTVNISGGFGITTTRSGDNILVAFVNPGYLSSQRTATLDVQGDGANPYIRLNDGTSDLVQVVGGGTVTVTGSESLDRITITGTDTNTDINVNDSNLRARLAGLNPLQGVAYIGDGGNDLDLRIRGNLTITGTTTSVNTANLNIADNFMVVNSDYPNQAPTEDAGIEVERGSYTNAFLKWNESSNRWQQSIGDTAMAYHNMSYAPDNADQTSFVIRDDSNSAVTITRNETLAIDGGTAIATDFVTVETGESHRLQINHSNVSHTDTTAEGTTLAHSGQFSVVSGVDVNAQGHVTQVITKPFTLPAGSVPNNATITISGGTAINTLGGNFTTDQSTNETITLNHSDIARTNTTTTAAPAYGATFTAISAVTSNSQGHITGVQTKTVTIPASDNTDTNQLTTFQVEDGDGTEVTISHGKEWKFVEGNDIDINWSDITPGSDADPFDLTFAHKDTARTNTTTTAAPTYGGTFTAVSGVTSNTRGHVTGVQTKTVTIPASDNTDERYTFKCVQNVLSNNDPYLRLDGSTESPQYILLTGGANVAVTRGTDASLTISATDSDTTYSHSFVDNGANVIHRLAAGGSGTGSDDIQYVPGGIVTLTPSGDDLTISAPGTDLATTYSTTSVTIRSSTGTNAAITEASGTQAGVMSVTHHNKLDGISASADVNQNAFSYISVEDVGIITADSPTDTLYVNSVDGIEFTGNTTYDSMSIGLMDDQRITSTTATIYVGNTDQYIKFIPYTSGPDSISFYLGTSTSNSEDFRMTEGGTFHADADIIAYSTSTSSDIKLKENIKTVENALDKVCQLDGVTFEWIKDGKESAGVIAQNVEDVLPSAVKDTETLNTEGETHKVVDYNQLSALFIEAIKELKEENKLLRSEIENLKDINN